MQFHDFSERLRSNFKRLYQEYGTAYETNIDKDILWNMYLDSFPNQKNQVYRTRREYDCSCCRHFVKNIGGVVFIDRDLSVHTIWEFDAGDADYQSVINALDTYVKSLSITDVYISGEANVGTEKSHESMPDGSVHTWEHFFVNLPAQFVHTGRDTIDTRRASLRDTASVFKRSLSEISIEAIDTVLDLINSNTLYKGVEWKNIMLSLREHKLCFDVLPDDKKSLYAWLNSSSVGNVLGRIRNHSIGVLLTDITNGVELDEAVRSYERIVAPTNYKRPKAIFTAKMLEEAKQTITELGYMDSLARRYAKLDDITVNNILYSNKDSAKRIKGSVFDEMRAEVSASPKKFDHVEEIPIDKFVSDVLPGVREMEAFIENRHAPNMVSLLAPVNKEAPSMFKWNNPFSWAYSGNITDSDVRENVKNAGGSITGVLRFSIQWNDLGENSHNDLDAHCTDAAGSHIYFGNKTSSSTRGMLDVDITNLLPGKPAVENITWASKSTMKPGQYVFYVHQYANRGGRDGFRAEIEFDGHIYSYDYRKELKQGEVVAVATVVLNKDGTFEISEKLKSATSSKEIWGVKSFTFVPVTVMMYSPNYWDEQTGIGNKHYMFMLNGCINPENPNGFYNEFLKQELLEHKRVFEALGGKMAVEFVNDQLSGVGFSSTKRNELIVKVKGATERIMKIKF